MIHLIWHSYIKRVKLLISATLLPNLLYLDDHLTPTSEHLADPVEELQEAFLAPQYEAGRMSLADEDATLAQTERTIARLKHRTRKGMKLIQAPEPMMLALQAAALTDFGERKRRTAHP